jgi:hypothetical protein
MDQEEESGYQFFIKDEQKWLEVEKYKADIEKQKTEKLLELGSKGIDAYKEFAMIGRRNITVAVFIFIGIVYASMAVLTYFGKVNGETFALVTGTIIGYLISILKQ